MIRRNFLRTILLVFISTFITEYAGAQITNTVYANTNKNIIRIKNAATDDVTGSPYLFEGWNKGNVKFRDNTFARNGDLRYDVMEDLLVTKGKDGEENLFTDPIEEFTLIVSGKERLFKNGFTGEKLTGKNYFEVIYNGKTKFLKRYIKTIIESRVYNSATTTKKFDETSAFFIAKADNTVVPVKRNEKAILEVLNKPELSKYVKDNKLNLKDDEAIVKLFAYYDTL